MDRLTSLRVFQTIGETGSFSAAAERLGLSAAMASKHVHALEQQLGTRLFQRTTRRVSLTEAGQDYARRIALVLAQLEEADAAAMQQSVDIRGRVRLSAPISFGMRVLGGWLAGLAARYPQLEVELELSDRQVDLIDEGFDLALRITTTPLADGIPSRSSSTATIRSRSKRSTSIRRCGRERRRRWSRAGRTSAARPSRRGTPRRPTPAPPAA